MTTGLDQLQRWLREQHVSYCIHHHRQALAPDEVAAELHELPERVARVVVAQVEGKWILLVVPAAGSVDFRRTAQLARARAVSAVSEADCALRFPTCEPGALPPFGRLFDLPTYVDEALLRAPKLLFLAGTHHDTVKLDTEDYVRLAAPVTGRLTRERTKAEA
jgi:Ala-tRNA(Pro) deacylase